MARSLLPSKNREAARRDKALRKRGGRHTRRQALLRVLRDPERLDAEPALDRHADTRVGDLVGRRRWGDKLGPFLRWATAVTRELPRDARLGAMTGRVPRGVIGLHALSHVRCSPAFESTRDLLLREARRRRPHPRDRDHGELARLLRALLEAPGGHATLNRFLKTRVGPKARLLHGLHDVRHFLAEAAADRGAWAFGDGTRSLWRSLTGYLALYRRHRPHLPPEAEVDRALPPLPPAFREALSRGAARGT
jgi:hypothetical protein